MKNKEIYDFLIKVQSICKIGLLYSKDPYAISNYKELNDLSLSFLKDFNHVEINRPNYFSRDVYPTPNLSVRTVIFNEERNKVLMVREVKDHTYSLPGGWCDLYDSPSEAAKKECLQEAGADVEIVRLVGIIDRIPNKLLKDNLNVVPEYVLIFEAKIVGKLKEHEYETDDVKFFDINKLPKISQKTSYEQLNRILTAAKENKTIFD